KQTGNAMPSTPMACVTNPASGLIVTKDPEKQAANNTGRQSKTVSDSPVALSGGIQSGY
ncbi:hypothetical protein GGI05_006239, partial [Coemansia sp. RSA 2603]